MERQLDGRLKKKKKIDGKTGTCTCTYIGRQFKRTSGKGKPVGW